MIAMMKKKAVYKISIALFIAIVLVNSFKDVAFACTPFPPTPWFSENLSLVETNFPSTVTLSNKNNIGFVNTTDTPFNFQYNGETKSLGTEISLSIDIYDEFDMVLVNDYGFGDFKHLNKIADNRPDNTVPPTPQDIVIPVTLEEKQYTIKLRITYEINNQYTANSVEEHDNACSGYFSYSFPVVPILLVVIGGVMFLLLLIILIFFMKKNLL